MAMVNKEYLLKAFGAFSDAKRAPSGWITAMKTAEEIVEEAPEIKAEKFSASAKVLPGVLRDERAKIIADLLKDFAVSMYEVGAITINKEYEPPTGLVRISIQTLPMVRGEET